jgi:hypothetical protein
VRRRRRRGERGGRGRVEEGEQQRKRKMGEMGRWVDAVLRSDFLASFFLTSEKSQSSIPVLFENVDLVKEKNERG